MLMVSNAHPIPTTLPSQSKPLRTYQVRTRCSTPTNWPSRDLRANRESTRTAASPPRLGRRDRKRARKKKKKKIQEMQKSSLNTQQIIEPRERPSRPKSFSNNSAVRTTITQIRGRGTRYILPRYRNMHVKQNTINSNSKKKSVDNRPFVWCLIPSRLVKALPFHSKLQRHHLFGQVLWSHTN